MQPLPRVSGSTVEEADRVKEKLFGSSRTDMKGDKRHSVEDNGFETAKMTAGSKKLGLSNNMSSLMGGFSDEAPQVLETKNIG